MPTLADLRDIHLPPEPSAWPPAPGWWVLALALLLGFGVLALRRQRRRQPLQEARRTLEHLSRTYAANADAAEAARDISQLLRRYACWRHPQAQAQALVGTAWLEFLDSHGGNGRFQQGPGRALETLPYRRAGDTDVAALIALASEWLERNTP